MSESTQTKKRVIEDMHRADIIAALRKSGWSLRKLSKHHDYSDPTTLKTALDRPWPKGERLIADAIGVPPSDIWPTRYPQNTTVSGAVDRGV